jgi:mRNA interferase MazF
LDVVSRGEVWLTRLDPTQGHELQKTRPCLIVSPAQIHDYLDTIIVVPMTTGSRPASYRIETTLKGKHGRFLLEQIRSIDKSRLLRRLDTLDTRTLSVVLATLRLMFAE